MMTKVQFSNIACKAFWWRPSLCILLDIVMLLLESHITNHKSAAYGKRNRQKIIKITQPPKAHVKPRFLLLAVQSSPFTSVSLNYISQRKISYLKNYFVVSSEHEAGACQSKSVYFYRVFAVACNRQSSDL